MTFIQNPQALRQARDIIKSDKIFRRNFTLNFTSSAIKSPIIPTDFSECPDFFGNLILVYCLMSVGIQLDLKLINLK